MATETDIVQKIIAYIKLQGGDAFHVHGSIFQRKGEPDISGEIDIWRGWRHLKIEVKRPGEAPTNLQIKRLRHYHKAGYVAGVVTSLEDFVDLCSGLQNDEWGIRD